MPLSSYGVLKAAPVDTRRRPKDDHFQIHVCADGADWRIPVKVAIALDTDAAMPLFQSQDHIPGDLAAALSGLAPGFHRLGRGSAIAQDYVRGGLARVSRFRRVVPDRPGAKNDLKDYLGALIARAVNDGAWLYAFGEPWGPEAHRPDQVFGFSPGRGVHDIHMNQGSYGKWARDNDVGQDGALFLAFPDGAWRLLFIAFQTQSFKTDAQGDPVR